MSDELSSTRDNPVVRRHYVMAVKAEVPVPRGDWGVVLHPAGCEAAESGCHDGEACPRANRVRIRAARVAAPDMELAAVAMLGLVSDLVNDGGPADGIGALDLGATRLQAAVAVSAPIHDSSELGQHFDDCMRLVTDSSRALLQATGYLAPPVTRQQLWPTYVVVDERADETTSVANLVMMEDAYLGAEFADEAQRERAEAHLKAAWSRNPVEVYHDLRLGARRSGQAEGNYIDAVLRTAAAAEALLKHVAWQLTWEATEHLSVDPAPSAMRPSEVFTAKPSELIGGVLSTRLGGNWQSRVPSSPVGAWRHEVAQMRNRVIHRGHRPTENEAAAALQAGLRLETHVMDRLAAKAATYPRTACLLVGRDGLERRDAFGPARATWFNQSMDVLLRSYLDWVEEHDVEFMLDT